MTHKTQLHSKMLFSCQVGHCDGAMSRGPSWGPCSTRRGPCQPPRWDGQHHMALGEIRLLRVLFSVGGKKRVVFLQENGGKGFSFSFLFILYQEQPVFSCAHGFGHSLDCAGKCKHPSGFLTFVLHVLPLLLGCPGNCVSDLQPSLSHYRSCHNG